MAFLTALTTLVPAVAGIIGKIKEGRDARKAAAGSPALATTNLPALPTGGSTLPVPTTTTTSNPLMKTLGDIATVVSPALGTMLNIAPAVGKGLSAVGNIGAVTTSGLPDYLKPYALDASQLRQFVRAPKGYVIVHDAAGTPYAILKQIARMYHLWKPSAKPPIRATDYKHYKRNKVIEKKLKKIAGPIYRKHGSRSPAPSSRKK